MHNYEDFANAIIEQAILDYKRAIRYIKRHNRPEYLNPTNKKELRLARSWAKNIIRLRECEEFFNGAWYNVLTRIDGPTIIKYVHESIKLDTTKFYDIAALPPRIPETCSVKTTYFRRSLGFGTKSKRTRTKTHKRTVTKNSNSDVAKNSEEKLNIGYGMKVKN